MGFFNKIKGLVVGAAALGAVEQGMSQEAHAEVSKNAPSNKESAAHVEKAENPKRLLVEARQSVVDAMNETTFDITSGGILEGKGWKAQIVQEADGTLVAKIEVESGAGGKESEEFVIRKDEVTGGDGNIKDVYSFDTGVSRDDERRIAEAQSFIKTFETAGRDTGTKGGGKGVAMNQ